MTARRPVVLHVVESYGAGTATAMNQYVRATPELEHHLLRRLRPDDDHADDGELAAFASVAELPGSTAGAVLAVRRRAARVRPGVVHAHSSFAGAFTRLAVRRGEPLLVYTPHCFATERRDLHPLARAAYGAAERVLARNTDVVAACSQREADLARRLGGPMRVDLVVNVTDVERPASRVEGGPVTAMGRLAPQRDPGLFVELVRRLRAEQGYVAARWIGSGPDDVVAELRDAGIEVTGWLPRTAALGVLAGAGAYVHTARWDAAPMTLLEAQALRVPILARRTPALDGAPRAHLRDDAAGLAGGVAELLVDDAARRRNLVDWSVHFARHTVAQQRVDLLRIYGLRSAVGSPGFDTLRTSSFAAQPPQDTLRTSSFAAQPPVGEVAS